MKKLKIELENCYGINLLEKEFDFSNDQTYVIYSPNGTMKTSLSNTLKDFILGKETKDRVYSERITKRVIVDQDRKPLKAENMYVIEPIDEQYNSNKMSTLLVNYELKKEYETILDDINKKKDALLIELKQVSGINRDIEVIFTKDIINQEKKFIYKALELLQDDIKNNKNETLKEIKYNDIFTEKVIGFLNKQGFKDKLDTYISTYNDLIKNSDFFKKDLFDLFNANEVATNLNKNNFFEAEHTVYINKNGEKQEIKTIIDLKKAIENEKAEIYNNEDLKKAFNDIDNEINKNEQLRTFKAFISKNKHLIPWLKDLTVLKKQLWVSYLSNCNDSYNQLMNTYSESTEQIKKITLQAKKESTEWQDVINIFNERFYVPFKITLKNKADVILGRDEVPVLQFDFIDKFGDNEEKQDIERNTLVELLSQGEKRAFYILNLLFDIEARKKEKLKTLLVIDDIADSFDYKNKYAIIEYLKEISENPIFNQIILTHNFDFYRSMCSRLHLKRNFRLHAIKTNNNIEIIEEKYQNNVFKLWLTKFHENQQQLIALIPFIRNLAEYLKGEKSQEYVLLTSLLHIKKNTKELKLKDFLSAMRSIVINLDIDKCENQDRSMLGLIYDTANKITKENEEILELEKKIVLSIAIRLKAEEYMIKIINKIEPIEEYTSHQTSELIKKYESLKECDSIVLKILKRVNIMTPENIHLNSFMYEPILDMSKDHLVQLYKEVKELGSFQKVAI